MANIKLGSELSHISVTTRTNHQL